MLFGKELDNALWTPAGSYPIKMSEATFQFMVSSEDAETKARLRSEMEDFESRGIYKYTLYSEKWEYVIDNGQFRAAPIAPKGQ